MTILLFVNNARTVFIKLIQSIHTFIANINYPSQYLNNTSPQNKRDPQYTGEKGFYIGMHWSIGNYKHNGTGFGDYTLPCYVFLYDNP